MRLIGLLGMCGLGLCVGCNLAMADEVSDAKLSFSKIQEEILSGRIARLQVFSTSYSILTGIAITPKMLMRHPEKIVYWELSGDVKKSLLNAMENVELSSIRNSHDIRWGVVFVDESKKGIHRIFLSRRYPTDTRVSGYIDGLSVGFNLTLAIWLETHVP